MTEDGDLLRQYAETSSEEAFSELVHRHLPLVYSAALRQVRGNKPLAQDISQTVFIDLARKAASLSRRQVLAGWLFTSTRMAACKAIHRDYRRQLREQISVSIQEMNSDGSNDHTELRDVLDHAMTRLAARERDVLLLRFFQGKDLKMVGVALGVSEDAARMRVTRALEKLRTLVAKRGVALSAAALGGALATEAIAAVPAGLAGTISAVAVTSAGASAGTAALLKFLTLTKLKAGTIGAIVLVSLAVPVLLQQRALQHARGDKASHPLVQAFPLAFAVASGPTLQTSGTQMAVPPYTRHERELRRAKLCAQGAQLKREQSSHLNEPPDIRTPFWQSKVALFKAWLAELPERDIPEIQLSTDRDWLETAQWADLDSELGARKALGALRNGAKSRFAKTIIRAINQYAEAHDSQLPADLAVIKPWLEPALTDAVLRRYELSYHTADGRPSATGLAVVEKAPVDDDFDTRHVIGFYGYAVQLIGHSQQH
jgi:RNA polymerase sigma factor (sigma-70 family)